MKNIYIKIPRKKVEDTILRKTVRLEAILNFVTKPFKIDEFCNLHITNNIVWENYKEAVKTRTTNKKKVIFIKFPPEIMFVPYLF